MTVRPSDLLRVDPRVAEVRAGGVTIVTGGREPTLLSGPLYPRLLARLATPASTNDLVASLAAVASAPHVHFAVRHLVSLGVVVAVREPASIEVRAEGIARARLDAAIDAAGLNTAADAPTAWTVSARLCLETLEREAERAREAGQAWSFALGWAGEVWLGPLLTPSGPPCARCLLDRLRHNQPVLAHVGRAGVVDDPTLVESVVALGARRLAAQLAGRASTDVLARWHVDDARGSHHTVPRACPRCAKTEVDWDALVDPVLGVVARVEGVTSEAPHVAFATAPRTPPPGDAPTPEAFFRVSGGKGATAVDARRGAIAEAVERYAASRRARDVHVVARAEDLEGALSPRTLLHFSDAQYEGRESERVEDPRRRVPPRYTDAPIAWVEGRSLVHDAPRFVPASIALLDHREANAYAYDDPNGLASGASIASAAAHALYERVERDAVALWWYNEARRPGVALEAVHDSIAADAWRRLGSVSVLDLTTDLKVPVFAAIRHDGPEPRVGFGCAPSRSLALRRALHELAQTCAARRDRAVAYDGSSADFLRPHGVAPAIDDEALGFDDAVRRVAERGDDVVLIDLTCPGTGLATVRVVVPSLRHFWPRFGPGRLYDVPVELGWIAAPRAEASLNRAPLLW